MKKTIILLPLMILSALSYAQSLRVNTYAGYVFDDRFESYYSSSSYFKGKVEGGFQWGAGLEYKFPSTTKAFELLYINQNTNAPTDYRDDSILGGQVQSINLNLNSHWIMANGINYFQLQTDKIEPYIGAGIGMIVANAKNPDSGRSITDTKFAWNVKVGTNIWVTEQVGIKLQAGLMSAVQSVGGGLYFGTGGLGAGLSTYSTMYQFGFLGGLVVKL